MRISLAATFVGLALASSGAYAANSTNVEQELDALKQRIEQLESEQAETSKAQDSAFKFGGAARFTYSYTDYDNDNEDRGGDIDFELFRIGVDGEINGVILSAEYRWYQYMDVVHHAYVGYHFDEHQQGKIGVTQVPFGILTWASNSWFFSSNFYTGLEDDYDLGLNYTYTNDRGRLDLAFYKNDEQGGIDGYVGDRADRYSYDVVGVRLDGEGTFAAPSMAAGETNTFNVRYVHNFNWDEVALEFGGSGQFGQLELDNNDGDHYAAAVHGVVNYDRWNLKLQLTDYGYDVDGMDVAQMVVGAYAFFDSIPAEATSYMANIAYSLPVSIGPVSNLTFYNDYSIITEKSGNLADTFMNVTGVAIAAGGLFTYVDFVVAENQPFVGGSLVGTDGTNQRFNINVGYYF